MPNRKLNLAGQRFGKLAVIKAALKYGRRTAWLCNCDCGNTVTATTVGLRRKVRPVKSCGCLKLTADYNVTHGMTRSREFSAWQSMLNRCRNPNSKGYDRYGAAGIRVCERWKKFENFYADMGPRPTGTTIEREDGTGDYCPGNCCWATYVQQAQNRSSSTFITLPVVFLENLLGMSKGRIMRRLNNGWNLLAAVSTKPQIKYDSSRRERINASEPRPAA